MQAITHFAFGVLIQKYIELLGGNYYLNLILIASLAFGSHIFLDSLSIITYHPAVPKKTVFWKVYHIFILVISILFVVFYIEYWIGMLFASLPDIVDWLILRNYYWFVKKDKRYDISVIHSKIIDKVSQKCFFWLPNLREKEWSVVNEFIILIVLVFFIWIV